MSTNILSKLIWLAYLYIAQPLALVLYIYALRSVQLFFLKNYILDVTFLCFMSLL